MDNVEKFKTTWSIANNVQRTEIMGRIVGGILANKTINNLGKKVFTGGGKSWVGQEKIVGIGTKYEEFVKKMSDVSNLDKDLAQIYKNTILGRGSTGRMCPKNLNELLAMKEVLSNPLLGAKELETILMTDPRWLAQEGWVKMCKNVNGIEIHYLHNKKINNIFDDFKFKQD